MSVYLEEGETPSRVVMRAALRIFPATTNNSFTAEERAEKAAFLRRSPGIPLKHPGWLITLPEDYSHASFAPVLQAFIKEKLPSLVPVLSGWYAENRIVLTQLTSVNGATMSTTSATDEVVTNTATSVTAGANPEIVLTGRDFSSAILSALSSNTSGIKGGPWFLTVVKNPADKDNGWWLPRWNGPGYYNRYDGLLQDHLTLMLQIEVITETSGPAVGDTGSGSTGSESKGAPTGPTTLVLDRAKNGHLVFPGLGTLVDTEAVKTTDVILGPGTAAITPSYSIDLLTGVISADTNDLKVISYD